MQWSLAISFTLHGAALAVLGASASLSMPLASPTTCLSIVGPETVAESPWQPPIPTIAAPREPGVPSTDRQDEAPALAWQQITVAAPWQNLSPPAPANFAGAQPFQTPRLHPLPQLPLAKVLQPASQTAARIDGTAAPETNLIARGNSAANGNIGTSSGVGPAAGDSTMAQARTDTSNAAGTGLGSGVGFIAPAPMAENPAPHYPEAARRAGQQGVAWVRIELAADGHVTAAALLRTSGHSMLDQEALRTVRHWHFTPACESGQAVAIHVDVPVHFVLRAG